MHPIDFLLNRRSIRKFKPDLVSWDNIVTMINCAINAPVSGNVFNCKFIVAREASQRKAISDACYNQAWIAKAPAIICITAEPEHQKRYYGVRGEKLYTIQNAACCAMNIVTAAQFLGLGTCWVGSFDENKLRDVLGLPEDANVHVILPIGYPDESPPAPLKPAIGTVTYLERWWARRKLPAYGFYGENVMKMTKKAQDALKNLQKKILEGDHKEEKKGEK